MLSFNSLEVEDNKIRVFYPMLGKYKDIKISPRPELEHVYTRNKSVVAFVDEGKVFVTPYSYRRIGALYAAGFKDTESCLSNIENLRVPFSNGDIPMDKLLAEKWEKLLKEVNREHIQEFETACAEIAKSKGIKPLDEEFLQERCIRVPEEGLAMQKRDWGAFMHFPMFNALDCFDTMDLRISLGKYYVNNEVVAFIDHHGREYLMPEDYPRLKVLEEHGYEERVSRCVAMSNGERFIDADLQNKWDTMKKSSN